MKSLPLYIPLAFFSLFINAQAATIFEIQSGVSIFANSVSGSSGEYFNQTFTGDLTTPITETALSNAVTGSDLTKYAWTPDYHEPSDPDNAYIDLSFASNIYNGEGYDLALFFAGNATTFQDGSFEDFLFSLDVGADGTIESGLMGVTSSTTFYNQSGELVDLPSEITLESLTEEDKIALDISFFASYAMLDLDAFGLDQSTPLGDIRVYLGDSSMPALAAVGAYHTTVVPLPLSAVLFGSGLTLLSLFRRKRQA